MRVINIDNESKRAAAHPRIEKVHGHPWAQVQTLDGEHQISVSIGRLLYDEEGSPYLLAFQGAEEKRLYLRAAR